MAAAALAGDGSGGGLLLVAVVGLVWGGLGDGSAWGRSGLGDPLPALGRDWLEPELSPLIPRAVAISSTESAQGSSSVGFWLPMIKASTERPKAVSAAVALSAAVLLAAVPPSEV